MLMDVIDKFEKTLAKYFGSRYAVTTDSCTHAIELSLIVAKANNITVPKYTYLSVPMTLIKLNKTWCWNEDKWKEYYNLGNTNVIDAAVTWRENSYVGGSLMCVSFQCKKHLGLLRGGVILLDNEEEYKLLKKMVVDGRDFNVSWKKQDITVVGYHYYMTPETAMAGLEKFKTVKNIPSKVWDWQDYVDLSKLTVFKNHTF